MPAVLLAAMIALDEFVDRLCRLGADRGPRGFPSHPRDRDILIKSILLDLDSTATYTERQIHERLKPPAAERRP
jgi:hypothetical protein